MSGHRTLAPRGARLDDARRTSASSTGVATNVVSTPIATVAPAPPQAAPPIVTPPAPALGGRHAPMWDAARRAQRTVGNQAVLRAQRARGGAPIQRTCACAAGTPCACDEPIQRSGGGAHAAAGPPSIVRDLLGRTGHALPDAVRAPMEQRYRADFSAVQLHQGADADAAARAIDARAFTSGSHVVLGVGVDLHTSAGRSVLAHELAHVIQQSRGERPSGWIDSGRHDPLERAADAMSTADTAGAAPAPAVGPVQRQAAAPVAATPAIDAAMVERVSTLLHYAARLYPPLQPLAQSTDAIRAMVYLWTHRAELQQQLMDAISRQIATIPALVDAKLHEVAASQTGRAAEAILCVGGELVSFVTSLAANWREVMRGIISDLNPVTLLARTLPIIQRNFELLLQDIASADYRTAVDRGVAIMTEVNSIAGVVYIYFAILTTLIGFVVGTAASPGAGNAAGAGAGLTVAQAANFILLGSVAATETARIVRGMQDMSEQWDDEQRREMACRQVAEGIFSLVLTAAMFYFGPSIQRFARSIIQRATVAVRSAAARLLAGADARMAAAVRSAAPMQLSTASAGIRGYAPGPRMPPPGMPPPGMPPPGTARPPVTPGAVRRPPSTVPRPMTPALAPAPALPEPLFSQHMVAPSVIASASEQPDRRRRRRDGADQCLAHWGLTAGANDRAFMQRPPIGPQGDVTISEVRFRLDRGRPPPVGQRTDDPQRAWVRWIGGYSRDQAGHAIAHRFGGRRDYDSPIGNMFPQNPSINMGEMRRPDRTVANLYAARCDVCVRIVLEYQSATAMRPYNVHYLYMSRPQGDDDFGPVMVDDVGNPPS